MRNLNLRSYETKQKVQGGNGQPIEIDGDFNVKDSTLTILFLPALKLTGAALVKQNVLAIKIEQAGDEVILEEEEYERVVAAIEVYPAQGRIDVEFVDRILNQTPKIK